MEPKRAECSNRTPFALALITTAGFFGCLFFMLIEEYPYENKDLINTMVGSLGTIWVLQMQFFFGSSASSKYKDQTISQIATTPVTPSPITGGDVSSTLTKDTSNERPKPPSYPGASQ